MTECCHIYCIHRLVIVTWVTLNPQETPHQVMAIRIMSHKTTQKSRHFQEIFQEKKFELNIYLRTFRT